MIRAVPDQQIHVKSRRPWAAVPVDILEQSGLSPLARLVLIYLLGLAARPGWDIRVRHVQHALGLTQGAWQRARRELERAGYYSVARTRGDGGRLHWRHEVRDEGTIGCKSTDGAATGGNPADIHSSRDLSAREKKHARGRARGPAVPARAAAGDAGDQDPEPTPHRRSGGRSIVHGVFCWTDDDRAEADRLAQAHGLEAVRAAADLVRAGGQDPLPSRVADAIEQQQRAVRAAAAATEADNRLRRIEALGRIQADQLLGLITSAEAKEAAQKLGMPLPPEGRP